MRPSVLVLDEPTANLDPRGRRRFIDLIRGLPATKLIATHDLEMVLELCDRTILLDAGRVVANGLTRNVLGDPGLLEAHGLEMPLSLKIGGAHRYWKVAPAPAGTTSGLPDLRSPRRLLRPSRPASALALGFLMTAESGQRAEGVQVGVGPAWDAGKPASRARERRSSGAVDRRVSPAVATRSARAHEAL